MKRAHKKIFGFCGLLLVVAMTIFAMLLPTPTAQAADYTSVTDTIQVRVVGSTPAVNISGVAEDSNIVSAQQNFAVTYENIEYLNLKLQFTDVDGNVYDDVLHIPPMPVDYTAGVSNVNINFKTGEFTYDYQVPNFENGDNINITGLAGQMEHYGYGEYVMTAYGESIEGVPAEFILSFQYIPVDATITEDNGVINVDLNYDADDGTGDGEVAKVVIVIKDEDGNVVKTVEVTPPTKNVQIDLASEGLAPGKYVAEISAYDRDGNQLYKPFVLEFIYNGIPAPNTGGIMGSLNISKSDYLVTGLIIFGVTAVAGVVFIIRHDKRKNTRRRK